MSDHNIRYSPEGFRNCSVTFSLSLLLFWIHGSIEVTKQVINIKSQNTIFFGLIPAGENSEMIPISKVEGVSYQSSIGGRKLGSGILLILVTCLFIRGIIAMILVLMGVISILTSLHTRLIIKKQMELFTIDVPFYNKKEIIKISKAINNALIYAEDKIDNLQASVNIVDAINGLRRY